MVTPFGLRHSLLVYRLQRSAERLDMVQALTRPRSPLMIAVLGPFPWRATGVATYVLQMRQQGRRLAGFAQILKRPARPESDVLVLAPTLRTGGATDDIWLRLLTKCSAEAGEHGVQRMFASAAEGGSEVDVLRQVGFVPYTQETVYCLVGGAPVRGGQTAGIHPQHSGDSWGMQRLYQAVTPPVVQQAEGALESENSGFPPLWWETPLLHSQGYVLSQQGEVTGAAHIQSGPAGHWLRIWSADNHHVAVPALLNHCLATLNRPDRNKPIYCAVRDYQSDIRLPLQDAGFQPYARRSRLVKHLTVRVKDAVPQAIPVLVAHAVTGPL